MSNTISYNGYVASVDFDPDAALLRGKVINAREPLEFEAAAAGDVLQRFRDVIDSFLAECEAQGTEPGKPYSGKLLLRIDPILHARLATEAARLDWSINRYVEFAIERTVSEGESVDAD